MSKLGSLYIKLGSPEGELSGGCCEIDDWAADEIERLRRVTYQWDQVFGHLGETPDACGNAIHEEFDKRDAESKKLQSDIETLHLKLDIAESELRQAKEELVKLRVFKLHAQNTVKRAWSNLCLANAGGTVNDLELSWFISIREG